MIAARTRRVRLAILGGIAAVGLAVAAHPVEAAWSDPELATASATAGVVVAPAKTGTCTRNAQGTNVAYAWTQPTGGLTRDGYFAGVYAVGGTTALVSGTLAATATTVTYTPGTASPLAANTQYELRVQATSGTWQSSAIVGTFRTGSTSSTIASCTW